jgi:hypothetical protein
VLRQCGFRKWLLGGHDDTTVNLPGHDASGKFKTACLFIQFDEDVYVAFGGSLITLN